MKDEDEAEEEKEEEEENSDEEEESRMPKRLTCRKHRRAEGRLSLNPSSRSS